MATAEKKTPTANGSGGTAEEPDIRHIEIPKIDFRQASLHLVGISPLIMHKWSAKAAKLIEDKVTGKAKEQRGNVDPEESYRNAAYVIHGKESLPDWQPGKYCFPASAFKHAFLYGVTQLGDKTGMPKTKATGYMFPSADPVLDFESCELRMDMGRNPTQPIYRPYFHGWSCDLHIGYNARTITLEQVVALFDLGGFAGGIGEWRPSSPVNKSGSFGRFRVEKVNA